MGKMPVPIVGGWIKSFESDRNFSRKNPILVTGSIRSGTTFTGKMLSLANNIGYIHEPFNHYRGIQRLNTKFFFAHINSQNAHLYSEELKYILNYKFKLIRNPFTDLTLYENIYVLKCFLESWIFQLLSLRPLIKDPIALFSTPWLAENFNMDVVVMIRHPAAFVSSVKFLGWSFDFNNFLKQPLLMNEYLSSFKLEIEDFAKNEHSILMQATLLWKIIYSTVNRFQIEYPNWIYLRHEDLSENPIREFKSLYAKLDLNITKKIETKIMKYTHQDLTNDPIYNNPFTLKRNSSINIKYWKSRLTEGEINFIKGQVSEVSSKFYSENEW